MLIEKNQSEMEAVIDGKNNINLIHQMFAVDDWFCETNNMWLYLSLNLTNYLISRTRLLALLVMLGCQVY